MKNPVLDHRQDKHTQSYLPCITFLAAVLAGQRTEQQLTAAAVIRGLSQQQGCPHPHTWPHSSNRDQKQLPHLNHYLLHSATTFIKNPARYSEGLLKGCSRNGG